MHKRKGQLKVQPSHAQVRSKKIKILTEGFFFCQKRRPLRTFRLTLSSESAFSLSGGVSTGRTGDGGKKRRANQMAMNTHERKVEAEVTRR